jgi:hypothetical protein
MQAHLQAPQSAQRPKLAKELAYPNALTERQCSKNEKEMTRKINNETLTKAICNKGFSGNSSILPRIKFGVTRQESSPQSLTAHSLKRYQ